MEACRHLKSSFQTFRLEWSWVRADNLGLALWRENVLLKLHSERLRFCINIDNVDTISPESYSFDFPIKRRTFEALHCSLRKGD